MWCNLEFKIVVNEDSWVQKSCWSLVDHKSQIYCNLTVIPFFFPDKIAFNLFYFGIVTIDFKGISVTFKVSRENEGEKELVKVLYYFS